MRQDEDSTEKEIAQATDPCIIVANTKRESMDIRSLIHEIRGQQVMLDRDLAILYEVETKALNQAVKRNIERFPKRFMFQINREETQNLKSQIVTSSHGGDRYLPYAFTEQGIAMLSAVLRSAVAIQVSIRIMDAFVEMRRTLDTLAPMLTRLETVERKQITDQASNETRFDAIFSKMNDCDIPAHQIFFQGKFWDAKSLFEAFGRQYGSLVKSICGICHDRFIIVDNSEIYSIGASLKDVGRLTFGISKMGAAVIPGLLDNLRNAVTERKEYGKGK